MGDTQWELVALSAAAAALTPKTCGTTSLDGWTASAAGSAARTAAMGAATVPIPAHHPIPREARPQARPRSTLDPLFDSSSDPVAGAATALVAVEVGEGLVAAGAAHPAA